MLKFVRNSLAKLFVLPNRPRPFKGKGAPEQFPQESVRHYDGQPISQFWHSPRSCPIDPTGGSKSQASSSRDATSSSNRHFLDRRLPQELPNYVNHLQHLWRDNHLRIAEGEHYCVRTWYIHHTHHPVWRVPRFIDLTEDVLTWHRKVLSSWSDHIHYDELLNIAIATPEVRVQTTHKQHHADLVLIQGDPERKGAIITVYPPGVEEHLSTTLAVSLPEHVSGMDVITGAEAQDLLLSHACDVFHAGFQLPIGTVPTHWMANGHTFVVIFQDMQTETNNEIESALPALSSETIDQAETLDEEPIENENEQEGGESEPHQESSSSFDEEALQGLWIHQLHQPAHCFVRWTTYNVILFDALQSVGLHRDLAVGFHYVQAPLVDQHEAEESIIIQRVGDIEGGSPAKLVIVDLTFAGQLQGSPTYHRRVQVFPRHLSRTGVLQELNLADPCVIEADRCTLHLNNALWAKEDAAPRELAHGAYLRLEVRLRNDEQEVKVQSATQCSRPLKKSKHGDTIDSGDGASFFQTGTGHIVQHSSAFPSLASTRTDSGTGVTRPAHIPQMDARAWMVPARAAFRQCAEVEHEDEGPVIYWKTWYLHYQRYTRNSESRTLRLDEARQFWFPELCDLWRDAMDPFAPARVIFVHPNPPETDNPQHIGHLILVQGQGPGVPVLVSGLFEHPIHRRVWHFAALAEEFATKQEILDILGIQRWCDRRECTCTYGGVMLAGEELARLQDGDSVVTSIGSPTIGQSSDVTSLMQSSGPPGPSISPASTGASQAVTGHHCPGFQFNPDAPAFDPSTPDLRTLSEFMADLWERWDAVAFAWEDEDKSTTLATWFVDHRWGQPHGFEERRQQLFKDYANWEDQIQRRWHDLWDVNAEHEFHVVEPQPPCNTADAEIHVIVIQHPNPSWVTNLVTREESTRRDNDNYWRMAVTTHEHIWPENILLATQMAPFCRGDGAQWDCEVWISNRPIQMARVFQGRSGYSIILRLRPLLVIVQGLEPVQMQESEDEANLLQIASTQRQSHARVRDQRLTDRLVAHDCRPSETRTLHLAELLAPPLSHPDTDMNGDETRLTAVRLLSGADELQVPHYVEVKIDYTAEDLVAELRHWGLHCQVIQFGLHESFLCLPVDHTFESNRHFFMFANDDTSDDHGIFLHAHHEELDHRGILRLLDQMDYPRAVIISDVSLPCGLRQIRFRNVVPTFAAPPRPMRSRTAWPDRTVDEWQERKLFPLTRHNEVSTQRITTGFNDQDVQELVDAGAHFLQTSFEGIDLPDFVMEKVNVTRTQQKYDRWLIYTDGSSQSTLRRIAPERVDELGVPDTWAMLVLGEKFLQDGQSLVEPIGWCTHPVRYDANGSCYTHATRIGAEVAERDALIWSGIWRLTQDSITPTIFCCDSLTCGRQAFGLAGTGDADPSYRMLRGIFQALEHGLPQGHLRLHHVTAHAGDPYNEFVDIAAKREGQQSFLHRRADLDLQKWQHIFPHLWLCFASESGLPPWRDGHLAVELPKLPSSHPCEEGHDGQGHTEVFDCTLSMASANVLSLSRGPQGHSGKLHYLYAQMQSFGLHVLGVQESRSDEGVTTSYKILRISGGHAEKQCGVELWVNLQQPIATTTIGGKAYFAASDFQVIHRDPRRLLVRAENKYINCWFFVGHGPHSGRPKEERSQWWAFTTEILRGHLDQRPCFWMIDANAEPGTSDNQAVFQQGLRTSKNTDLWRACLRAFDMSLPSTTCIHQGERDTWTAIDGATTHCIDYVAVPSTWLSSCTWSQVLHDLDLATSRDDHHAVGLELRWQELRECRTPTRSQPSVEWSAAEIPDRMRTALDSLIIPEWSTDIEQHEKSIRQQVQSALHAISTQKRSMPKKPYLTDDIWDDRRCLLQFRRKLKQTRAFLSRECLASVFKAWSSRSSSLTAFEEFQYGSTLRTGLLHNMAGYVSYRKRVRTKITLAKHNLMQQRLSTVNEHTSASGILHLMRDFTGPTNPKKAKQKTIPMIYNKDNVLCRSPTEALEAWITFFASMEGGQRQSKAELREDWISSMVAMQPTEIMTDVRHMPTLVDLELAFRRVACNKAVGPDGIPGEVCHYAPTKCARANIAILWKLLLLGQEPLMYKGGLLVQAYKGKGAKTSCASFRSLLISSHFGKSIHRALRSQQASVFEKFLQAQQLGGRRAMPVTYGVHLARAYMRQAKAGGRSCAIVFLDLKEAFYRIFRPICMKDSVTDEDLAKLMHKLNMPEDAVDMLRVILAGPSALEQAELSEMESRCLKAVHRQTHFWMRQQEDVVQTKYGSRPGDPFADVVFSYVWAVVLRKLQHFMRDNGLLSSFPHLPHLQFFSDSSQNIDGNEEFIGPTWMDDLAVCIEADTSAEVVRKTGVMTGKLLELCIEHCMTPNLCKNKTEALFSFRGPGSRRYKKLFYGPDASGSLAVVSEYGMHHVPVTTNYSHLGGLLHHSTDQKDEIKRRIGIACAAFNHHSKLIFRNWSLPLAKRTQLFESLVLSKLLYGAETWVVTENATVALFNAAVIKLYRRLLRVQPDQHLADDAILSQVCLPSPIELVRRARLRYVATLFHCGERSEWGLLAKDMAWTSLVEEDMVWVWDNIWHSSTMPDPRTNWSAWKELIVHHRSYWRRLVRRACEHAIAQRRKVWLTHQFYEQMTIILRKIYDYEPHDNWNPPRDIPVYGCLQCQKQCRNKAGEAAHMFRAHQHVAKRRFLSDSTACPSCLKEYHTMQKLMAHLYYVNSCRQTLLSRNYVCPPGPGAGSQEDQVLCRVHDRMLPPLQTEGPQLPEPRMREETEVDNDLHLFFMETFLDANDLNEAMSVFEQEAQQRPLSWTTWTSTLRYFMDNLEDEDVHRWQTTALRARTKLEGLLQPEKWNLCAVATHQHESLSDLEQESRDVAGTSWPQRTHIPPAFGKHRVLLHMFSGRRRVGDVQFFLDRMTPPDNYVLHVVSMDVVVDRVWGDAMAPGTRDYWLRAATDGYIAAFLAGPPCETWSKARGQQLKQARHSRGPRILRTEDHLWGLPCLALKEVQQVITGNELLTFTLLMAGKVICTGGSGVVEHPAEPEEPQAASIWKLPAMLALLQAPGVQRHRLCQGLFGAPSAKPTELLTINLPRLPLHLQAWMTRSENPRGQAIGLTEDGFWRTGYLKEYPPAMCGALADAFRTRLDSIGATTGVEPSEADKALWRSLTVTAYSSHMGADYAG